MLPFVGQNYVSANHSKLLILGESFYFPEESTLHKEPSRWYSANQSSLTEEEVEYVNCRGLLECAWRSDGHKMYREINNCLAKFELPTRDRPISHISYTNTFLRPAIYGDSFKDCRVQQDIVVSVDTLTRIIASLTPDIVIFASKYAWDEIGLRIEKQISGTMFRFVSHPADPRHWNVESYPHGREKFISLLKTWVAKAG